MPVSNLKKYGSLENYLLSKITIDPITNCWNWIGCKVSDGYGIANWLNEHPLASRLSYIHFIGPIHIDRPFICHHCDNPTCINPFHLFAGSPQDNMDDMINKRRNNQLKGSKNPNAKLSPIEVRKIRIDQREAEELALIYGVHRQTIYNIKNRVSYRDVI